MMTSVPTPLQPLATYVERARELKSRHPHASHQLKLLVVHAGMILGSVCKQSKRFLLELMEELEQEKGRLPGVDPSLDIRALAIDLCSRARAADKPDAFPSAVATWTTTDAPKVARAYHSCAVCYDALRMLRDLTPDVRDMDGQLQQYGGRPSSTWMMATQSGRWRPS